MKVLIAEDDVVSRKVLEATLRNLGYEVLVASDGAQAWQLHRQDPVRLVVSDWMMPELDGLQLCRRIRERQDIPYTYFILLTAIDASQENFRRAMEEGVDDFLSKPLNKDLIWARLKVGERILQYTTQIGQLKALLPICMYCKKIRDDNDYWRQVEEYISLETGTDFSHGICPECYEHHVIPQLQNIRDESAE
jgi:CheY-like chemotaxis protein